MMNNKLSFYTRVLSKKNIFVTIRVSCTNLKTYKIQFMLTLTNIQNNVPKDIWLRGKSLLTLTEFVNVKQLTLTEWVGFVCSTEKYKVIVHVNGEEIVDWQCDCNHGNELCEHVVAVLCAIQNELNNISPYPFSYISTYSEKKGSEYLEYPEDKPFIKKNIKSLLESWPNEELVSFLGHYASTHPDCEAALLDEFLDSLLEEPGTNYREKARQCFENPSKKGESLFHYSSGQWRKVYNNLIEILETARELTLNNRFMEAADIALEIVDYIADHFTEIPDEEWFDSNELFEIFEEVTDVLRKILADPQSPDEVNEKIFREMSDPEMMELFIDDGIYIPIFQTAFIACGLTQKPEDVLDFIDRTIDTVDVELMQPSMLTKRAHLLRFFGKEEEAGEGLKKYLAIEEVRGGEIKYQLSCGNYERAFQLLDEVKDKPQQNFSAWSWDKMEREIYEDTGNTERLINYYKKQLLEKNGGVKSFEKLKELLSPDQWKPLVEELLSKKKPGTPQEDGQLLDADILAYAEMYDELLDFLMSRSKDRLNMLVYYSVYFRGERMDKLKPVLEKEICQYASRVSGKSGYEAIGRMLQSLYRMEEWREFVDQMIEKLKTAYPARTAMLRILDTI